LDVSIFADCSPDICIVSFFVQLQRELNTRDITDGGSDHGAVFFPQAPRSPRSPCMATPIPAAPPMRSHSDSEAMLGEQGAAKWLKGPTENLFLEALSLDPLSERKIPSPSGLEREKRFPCMKEVTHSSVAL